MFGTLELLNTLATQTGIQLGSSVIAIGEDRIYSIFEQVRVAWNQLVNEAMTTLADQTTEQLRRYGGGGTKKMQRASEYGVPDAQKTAAGDTVGFPIDRWEDALQWTRDFFENTTGEELNREFSAMFAADQQNIYAELMYAVFHPFNRTFNDTWTANQPALQVKAFVNADGSPIPPGPGPVNFNGSTHTHYLAVNFNALSDADKEQAVKDLITTVIEHYGSGTPMLYINEAQEEAIRLMPAFVGYIAADIQPGSAQTIATGRTLSTLLLNNRAIGIFNNTAQVWTKPWIPPGYMFVYLQGQPKPLAYRVRPNERGFYLIFQDELHPLRAQAYRREFGFGSWNRTNGAVLYLGGGAYVEPTNFGPF